MGPKLVCQFETEHDKDSLKQFISYTLFEVKRTRNFVSNDDTIFAYIFLTYVFNTNVAFINTASIVCNCWHKSSLIDGQPFRVFIIRVLFHIVKINSLKKTLSELYHLSKHSFDLI